MIKKNYFFLLIIILLAFSAGIAQEKDEYGNINIKGLSQADMERIFGDIMKPGKVYKAAGETKAIKSVIISGNKITTIVYNYGSITKPNTLSNIADLVWQGLGHGFEFGPLAAGEVSGGGIDTLHIVDDSFVLTTQGSYSPDGTLKWGWLPKEGFADPDQDDIATLNAADNNGDGKPDSWPESFYSPGAGKYVWPAFLGDQATAPDEEVYYIMDDYTNAQFPYYPFPSDSSKRGLGLDAEVRILQFSNPLAEDILFLVYRITNSSEKVLNKLYFGMQGDPHMGGSLDYSDDRAFFIPPEGALADPYSQRARSMVYAFDDDNSGLNGRPVGYFGWKFLESPSSSTDALDNDDDGILNESPFNTSGNYIDGVNTPLTSGIFDIAKYTAIYGAPKPRYQGDEDGDWEIDKDDIGIDGIAPESPNYPGADFGEGDGVPSQAWYQDINNNDKFDVGEALVEERLAGYKWAGSETNFGLRDISESDQLGLTSFHAAVYTNSLPNVPKNTSLMWEWLSSGTIDPNQTLLQNPGDNIFNFGTGPLSLERGESQRFSMAILFGDNLNDLLLNAESSTRVLESDYRFAKPPDKPTVTAVPGNHKVTLYWDNKAEESFDPFVRLNDFQGYKIYRSRDYTFADIYTITDGNGVPFLGQPLFDQNTGKSAQFDLIDSLSGFFPVEYQGRAVKYYVGNNTGLVHEYIDSTALNGVTYYYAVVAYDGGSDRFGLPPTETQAVIKRDPITNELIYDINTVSATPGSLPAGVKQAEAGIGGVPQQLIGNSTGKVTIKVLNDLIVEPKLYKVNFPDANTYNVLDSTGVTQTIVSNDTIFVDLSNQNIQPGSFQLFDESNNLIDPSKYTVNPMDGKIRGYSHNSLPQNETFTAKYRYYPVWNSKRINGEDGNPAFNGVRIYVKNDPLEINYSESKFIVGSENISIKDTVIFPPAIGAQKIRYRADWEIRWNDLDTTASGQWANIGDTALSHLNSPLLAPFKVVDITENKPATYRVYEGSPATRGNGKWDWGEGIILQPTGVQGATTTYQINFNLPDSGAAPVFPQSGDVYLVKTTKPFQTGDTYQFQTQGVEFESAAASNDLNNIYVVPNPYVAYSLSENPGRNPDQRGDRDLQFRNLPPKCTIKIFTVVGELVQTIEKDDMSSIAHWDLLSNEAQKVAYGVYIYHVEAPGVGEKIGRFAVIK